MSFPMPLANPAGLSADNLAKLKLVLAKLYEADADLHDRLVQYLVDGTHAEVLDELPKLADGAEKLRLGCATSFGHVPGALTWFTFFRDLTTTDFDFYLRVTRAFSAVAMHLDPGHFFWQGPLGNNRGIEALLQEVTAMRGNSFSSSRKSCNVPATIVLRLLAESGASVDEFLKAPFEANPKHYQTTSLRELFATIREMGQVYVERRDLVVPFLTTGSTECRLQAIENLKWSGADPAAFTIELVAAATDSSKTLREMAQPLVAKIPEQARTELERLAREGDRTAREQAVKLLGRLCGNDARELLASLLESEKSAPVREAISAALAELQSAIAPAANLEAPPPHVPLDLYPPVTPALRQTLEKLFADYNRLADEHNTKLANKQPKQHIYPNHALKHVEQERIGQVCRGLEQGSKIELLPADSFRISQYVWGETKRPIREFLEHPDCRLIHAVRFYAMTHSINLPQGHHAGIEWPASAGLELHRAAHQPAYSLRDLADAIRSLDLSDTMILEHALDSYFGAFDWEWEAVWPYYFEKLDRLAQVLSPASGDWMGRYREEGRRNSALRLLAKFPQVPPQLVGKLWELAIGPIKADRQKTQPICAKLPDVQERLAQALTSGNFQTRQVAAEWLGRMGDARAVEPLTAAAKKEKQDAALDAMLTALERLGQSVEPFLDRDKLQADAAKNLKKGTPPALAWFPWTTLPQVHWQDSGKPVPAETISWLIVQSYKLKNPEAGSLLKRYCEKLRPADRETLGNFVLSAWLNQDLLRKHTDAECRTLAAQQAPARWQMYQSSLPYYQQSNQPVPASYPKSQAECEEQIFRELQRVCGSAAGEKGVLAVASACCGDAAVAPIQKYLKEWYGHRAAQCKALIAMLAGVDRPLAIQYLLSIANRFRTKGIRDEAEKYVQLLADRKGWTLDELADRTMPTCGLDDDGKLEFSYGPRSFTARVNAELEIVLYDSDGKALKKLPDPRKDDDEEQAKAAKKAFSAAKSELKKFVDLTSTRLYEAMCTERLWPAADWQMYLHEHPLARLLCQRLVWAVIENGAVTQTFRPLDDGSLTDVADNSVTIPADSHLRIAHSCNVPSETAAAWATHLADYGVAPLFAQFARPPFALPDNRRRETTVKDFEGHLVEAFKLRSLATKLGYTRGQAEDGGWFYEYLKSFPGLGIEVHLGFSGNGLPEENRTIALTTLAFQRKAAQASAGMHRPGVGLALADIPAVLLAECLGDVRSIAAAGSGFDAEWEKKVQM